MEIEKLNEEQLGTLVQDKYETFWQNNSIFPIEIITNYAYDLAIAMYGAKHYGDSLAIRGVIEEGWNSCENDFESGSQLLMALNYLVSFCYDNDYYYDYAEEFKNQYDALLHRAVRNYTCEEVERLSAMLDY